MRTDIAASAKRHCGCKFRLALCAAFAFVAGVAPNAIAGPTITYGDEGYLTISYAFQYWSQEKSFTSSTNNGSSWDSFFRRNRLLFAGQANDMVGYYVQFEAGNDGKQGNADKSIFYRDAYVTVDYSDPLRMIVGRFKNTFTRENLEACMEPLSIDRAEVISYTPFGSSGGGTRDNGVALWGNLADGMFQYRVMVADGREGDVVPKKSPRITGRVHLSLWEPETDFGYHSNYLGTKKVLTIGAAYDYQAHVAYGNYTGRTDIKNYKAWTVDAMMEYPTASGSYLLSAAYMDYDTGNAINENPDPTLPVTSQLKAYYVKGAWLYPGKVGWGRVQPYFRYERSNYGVTSGLFSQHWRGGGVNYYFNGQNLRLSLEYANIKFDIQHPTDPSFQNYSQTTIALQFIF